MTKKTILFKLKNQKHYPKIKEGKFLGIAIQSFYNFIHGNCGYLFVHDEQKATFQNLEKERNQVHYFQLEAEVQEEEFKEDIFSNEGEKLGVIGRKKIYVEDSNWSKNIKVIYYGTLEYFTPLRVIKNENDLLHVEVEPKEFHDGIIDNLIFEGEKINQYRNLIVGNLGKEFKIPSHLRFSGKNVIETNCWKETEKVTLAEEKSSDKPEKTISEIKESLEKYYQDNGIKSVGLSNEDKELLDIVFNDDRKLKSDDFPDLHDRQRIEQIKNFLQSNGKDSLSYSDLIGKKSHDKIEDQSNHNWIAWLIGGTISFLVIILFFVIKKKWKKSYVK